MDKKTFFGLLILLVTGMFYGCSNGPSVSFEEVSDNAIARFTVHNPTDRDIESFKVELTYLSEKGETLKTDSVDYSMNDPDQPFIKAGEEMFIVQMVPTGTTSAKAKLLIIEYIE